MAKYLMGTGELIKRFGVTRQRVDQITKKKTFPEPFDTLTVGRVWRMDEVEEWIRMYRPDLVRDEPSEPEDYYAV